jgi:hypothetical protein
LSRRWDPLLESVTRRLEEDLVNFAQGQARPRKWRRRLLSLQFQLRHRWLDAVFLLVTTIPLLLGITVLIASYPWSVRSAAPNNAGVVVTAAAAPDYAGVVVTAATATAFGGVLFSLVSAPLQTASELSAGFGAELLQRRTLWLTGAWLVVLAIALFLLGALNPDREVAIAAGLLTGSALALVWTAARSLLASSDPLAVAQRSARFYSKAMRDGRDYLASQTRTMLPKELRNEAPGQLLVRQSEQQIVNVMLRQFKAGIEGALAHRQPAAAVALWDGALASFIEYAKDADGEIGESYGITQTLLSITDEMVKQGLAIPVDDVAVHAIRTLDQLFSLDVKGSYALVRPAVLMRLRNWVLAAWADDNTGAPVVAIETVGKLIQACVAQGAHEDALHALQTLHEIAAQAVDVERTHIALASIEQIVVAFSSFLGAEDDSIRRYLVRMWCEDARPLSGLRMAESKVLFMRATESVFPGISLWKRGLQEIIARLGPYADLSGGIVPPMCKWLSDSLASFGGRKENPMHYFAVDGLAVLYCLALIQAYAIAGERPPRLEEAKEIADVLGRWVSWLSEEDVVDVLLNADIAELTWSVLLSVGYVANDPDLLRERAAAITQRLDGRLEGQRPLYAIFSVEFVTGLLLASGRSEEEVAVAEEQLIEFDEWRYPDRGYYSDGLGRVPAANRNRVATSDPRIFDAINKWAVANFPEFVRVGGGSK